MNQGDYEQRLGVLERGNESIGCLLLFLFAIAIVLGVSTTAREAVRTEILKPTIEWILR